MEILGKNPIETEHLDYWKAELSQMKTLFECQDFLRITYRGN